MTDDHPPTKLQTAMELGYLHSDQVQSLETESRDSNRPAIEIAIRRGYLNRQQLDVIEVFGNPTAVVPGYRVEGLLGSGGAATVYKATQLRMNRSVAIKIINEYAARNKLTPKRFEREAQIIGQLQHPNIISAIDFGLHDNQLYLVMEFVDGIDAGKYLDQNGKIPEKTAWYMALQVCHALDSAHQVGIIHRDIKPANMILTDTPQGSKFPAYVPLVKIADFGLAKFRESQLDATITIENALSGTPYYMSPEQVQASDLDHRSDIYSLGFSIWHLIVGSPPILGTSPLDVITNKMKMEDQWLSEKPADISETSFALLKKMCRHQRDARIDNYKTLSDEIENVIQSLDESSSASDDLAPDDGKPFSASASVSSAQELDTILLDSKDDLRRLSGNEAPSLGMPQSDPTKTDPTKTHASNPDQDLSRAEGRYGARFVPLIAAVVLGAIVLLGASMFWKNSGDTISDADSGRASSAAASTQNYNRLVEFAGLPIPLFNGDEMDPTQRFSGLWDVADGGEGGKVLAGKTGARDFRCVDRDRRELANFRFQCGFRHHEAEAITFRGLDAQRASQFEVNISLTDIVLATPSEAQLGQQPLQQFDDNTFGYHLCRIEAHPDHWRVEVDAKLIGVIPRPEAQMTSAIQLEVAGKGWGHFESLQLRELK